ncbi:SIT4 phosphatase-associated protein-domain-containing protein [Gamsiella multidivaricata]|uniref:SIT4 phosphatase-associated protein-domain-containing protein n=1 Tax=Gamsiella multidivaricata TaxID=101098 RepID=UPI00221EA8EA|nr:SIT4 phosphatase-associated protein-domain-containing protein [Gamsiella multidivaricata]KAI7832626.1 SIT4 phosphatase-associated protein-domain-containing protein [Gamsiella multidivaricata]
MYWRFGHQNASVIDHLLESGNVSLEELLEQDDLIQECKAQNPRLIEYLRDPAVLQQLLSYIISDDLEDRARFKYPFIACEVIACEVWAIFESALSNIDMLVKFWEFLDRPPPLNPVQASYFAKVISVFLMKKTSEMLEFIKSQPDVVSKLLLHMSTSSIMDLLLKIISMEESPGGKGTVEWLSEQGLMPWLVDRLDPNLDAEVHSVASQVLLDIIAISQSSHPEQPSIGMNVLIGELKSEVIVDKLVGFMLDRNAPFSTSTLINGVTIFIELIRRNNSDYDVEPLPPNSTETIREAVDLSDLLKVLASRIEDFKGLLVVPRSVTGPIETSIGKQVPLGFERLKICEMFAELLHCSNMAVLNSQPIISVSADGTIKIPTVSADQPIVQHSQTVKEEMEAIKSSTTDGENSVKEDLETGKIRATESTESTVETSKESNTDDADASKVESDPIKATAADDKESVAEPVKENGEELKEPTADNKGEAKSNDTAQSEQPAPSTEVKSDIAQLEQATSSLELDDQATPRASPSPPVESSTTSPVNDSTAATSGTTPQGDVSIPVGDFLKMQFVDHRIIPTCFDLFFQFPWNNFLHTVVYDMVHQVFHRPMGDIGRPDIDGTYIPPKADQGVTEGWNRRLTISIFKDGQLTKRITDAQRLCDHECAQPKGVRLGYMGHLTYIADETVKLLELYSQTSLLPMLYEFIDLEDWWNYVSKVLKETKERDAQVLGGSRPNMMEPHKSLDDVHDDDFLDDHGDDYGSNSGFLGGEIGVGHEGDVASDQITNNLPEKFGSSDEDEDDEEGNWIGEYGTDTDFERRRAAAAAAVSSLEDPFGNRHTVDFDDSDDDEGVDEETWNSPWPNTFGDSKVSELGPATQFSATLTDWSEDFQDGFTEFKTAEEDGKDDFDFPPFSVDPKAAEASTSTAHLDTPGQNEVDPFGDSFEEPSASAKASASSSSSSSVATESTTAANEIAMEPVTLTNDGFETASETAEQTQKEQPKEGDAAKEMEPVSLAPVVHDVPKLEEADTADSSTAAAAADAKDQEHVEKKD